MSYQLSKKEVIKEIVKCGKDPVYFINNYTKISHPMRGLIPFKTINFGKGVNFSAGLPIIRTSPDHGTAFDIAGKNIADPGSFINAIVIASNIYFSRNNLISK